MTNNQWTGRWISNTHRVFAEALKIFNRNKPDNTCSKSTIEILEKGVKYVQS